MTNMCAGCCHKMSWPGKLKLTELTEMNINELRQYTVFREKTPYCVHNGLIVKVFLNGVSHFALFAYSVI